MRILGYTLLIFGGLFFGAAVGVMFGIENAGGRLLLMGGGVFLALKIMPPREEPEAIDVDSWRDSEPQQQPPSQTYIDNRKVYNITAATPEEAARALARLDESEK